jgi:outer membrane protein insertion porin family
MGTFIDFGNVFADVDSFNEKELRASAGIAFVWISPIGPLQLSFAAPINDKDGDDTESIQFTLGGKFF